VTEHITAEDIQRLAREVQRKVHAEVYGTAASTATDTTLPYATPPISGVSDLSLAVDGESGKTRGRGSACRSSPCTTSDTSTRP
jgi:hypothetical protein